MRFRHLRLFNFSWFLSLHFFRTRQCTWACIKYQYVFISHLSLLSIHYKIFMIKRNKTIPMFLLSFNRLTPLCFHVELNVWNFYVKCHRTCTKKSLKLFLNCMRNMKYTTHTSVPFKMKEFVPFPFHDVSDNMGRENWREIYHEEFYFYANIIFLSFFSRIKVEWRSSLIQTRLRCCISFILVL